MINPNFVIVGALLQFFGSWPYFKETLSGKVKPNRVTWFLWTLAPMLAFFAQISQGVGIQSLTTFIVGFVPLVILIASFYSKKGEYKLEKLDFVCGLFSLAGLFIWWITQNGNIAIFFSILADGLAAFPTIVKSWNEPETEGVSVYFFGILNSVIGILTLNNWNFEYSAFPIYLLILNLILTLLIQFKLGKKF